MQFSQSQSEVSNESLEKDEQSVIKPVGLSVLNNTKFKRTEYLKTVMAIVTEAILPIVSIMANLINILQLFLLGEWHLGWGGKVMSRILIKYFL